MLPYISQHCLNWYGNPAIKILLQESLFSKLSIIKNFECVSLWTVGRCRVVFFGGTPLRFVFFRLGWHTSGGTTGKNEGPAGKRRK